MTRPENPDGDPELEEESRPASRTQLRKEARQVSELVLDLVALAPPALDVLGLPTELREAIDLCQGLKIRARSRQKRLIAQILRAEDHEAIRRSMTTQGGALIDGITREKQNERWRARLIEEGDPALQEFMQSYPEADRQQLRTFVRSAGLGPEDKRSKRAQRELLRAIRGIRVGQVESR
ncbi:MAG: ribosome biogenesis factor YjgA [Myxococcota bacterium]|jgi:ribosome-associated protein|nr:ribosome biogenesis factor YjgA [Myxococcota bacterium]